MHYRCDIPYFVRSVMHYVRALRDYGNDNTFLYLITHRINSNVDQFAQKFSIGFIASVQISSRFCFMKIGKAKLQILSKLSVLLFSNTSDGTLKFRLRLI